MVFGEQVIYDRVTSQSRGFAFVTMATKEEAALAIEKLDGTVCSYPVPKYSYGSLPCRLVIVISMGNLLYICIRNRVLCK